MADPGQPLLVKANYNYKGANNDEVIFSYLMHAYHILDGQWVLRYVEIRPKDKKVNF